jgi:hypothetical protein
MLGKLALKSAVECKCGSLAARAAHLSFAPSPETARD